MALDTFIAGRFSSTYNSVDTGITQNGYELEQASSAEMIDETDAYGGSAIDFVYRGGRVSIGFESKAYKAGSITPFWPWGSLGVALTAAAPLGRLASDVAQSFVLTSTPATPAVAAPATLTGTKSILDPGTSAKLLYNSKVRNVPIRLLLLPSLNTGTLTWFTQT